MMKALNYIVNCKEEKEQTALGRMSCNKGMSMDEVNRLRVLCDVISQYVVQQNS